MLDSCGSSWRKKLCGSYADTHRVYFRSISKRTADPVTEQQSPLEIVPLSRPSVCESEKCVTVSRHITNTLCYNPCFLITGYQLWCQSEMQKLKSKATVWATVETRLLDIALFPLMQHLWAGESRCLSIDLLWLGDAGTGRQRSAGYSQVERHNLGGGLSKLWYGGQLIVVQPSEKWQTNREKGLENKAVPWERTKRRVEWLSRSVKHVTA